MIDLQPESNPPLPPDEPALHRNIIHRCRSLTVKGDHCRQGSVRGEDFCTAHLHRGPYTFSHAGRILVPLLEDASAIQLTCTRIANAALTGDSSPRAASAAIAACRVASATLPRPARLKPLPDVPPLPLSAITKDEYDNLIAPSEPWRDAAGKTREYDELTVHWNENEKVLDAAASIVHEYQRLIDRVLRLQRAQKQAESAAALASGQPDPWPIKPLSSLTGHCAFGTPFCQGFIATDHPCMFCTGVLPCGPGHEDYPGDELSALVLSARCHYQRQKQKEEADAASSTAACAPPPRITFPEPGRIVPDLDAADATATAPSRSSGCTRRKTVARRRSRRVPGSANHRAARASVHVVKLVISLNPNIPKEKNLVPPQKNTKRSAGTSLRTSARTSLRSERRERARTGSPAAAGRAQSGENEHRVASS